MDLSRISRRSVLITGGVAAAGATLSGCDIASRVSAAAPAATDDAPGAFRAVQKIDETSGGTFTDWDNEASDHIGHKVIGTFDSSGPAVWSAAANPDVFITSLGPGYSGVLSGKTTLPGVVLINAKTKRVVASMNYDLGVESYFEPHGLGVSPGGEWIYLPTGVSAGFGDANAGRWLVINAKTLKVDHIISTPSMPHHAKSFIDFEGNPRVIAYTFRGQMAVLDPTDENKVVGGWTNADLLGSGYLAFADPTGSYIWVSLRPASGMAVSGGVAVVDVSNWRVIKRISTEDPSPIYIEFTGDGKKVFVSNGHHSNIAEISSDGPPPTWKLVRHTQAGTAGPYGIRLNWDETQLWASGKGEGSHNRGMMIGLADPVNMPEGWGHPGAWYTGCLRNDHATLNAVALDELWLSCNSTFEVVVWDMVNKEVKQRIPMPDEGSTHSGSMVRYDANFNGEVLTDQNGTHGSARDIRDAEIKKAADAS